MAEPGKFDAEAAYDAEIAPLMDKIIEVCRREGIPMVASFCYAKGRLADDPEGLDFCSTVLSRKGWKPPEFAAMQHILLKTMT